MAYLDVEEAAQQLKVKPRTVRKYCREDQLIAYKPYKKWLIPEEEIEHVIQNGPREPHELPENHPGHEPPEEEEDKIPF